MRNRIFTLFRTLFYILLISSVFSCKKTNVEKVNLDNQIALSLFSDTVKVRDLLNTMDPVASNYIRINEKGDVYAYYADSIINAVVGDDILGQLEDVNFETSAEFELPTIPPSPVPVPVEVPFEDLFYVPFEYEGYGINYVELRTGKLILNISTDFTLIDELSLSTKNIKMSNGEDFNITLNFSENSSHNIDMDLSDCKIMPEEGQIAFSVMVKATISDQGVGGFYSLDLNGGLKDIKFKSIDGSIEDEVYEFGTKQKIDLSFPNLYGDLTVVTPEFSFKYVNSFGFEAYGYIDSLYLVDEVGEKISIVEDWNQVEIVLNSTGGAYDSISHVDEALIDEIDILDDYSAFGFKGSVVMGCEDVTDNMIADDSHIDVIADLALPLKFNIKDLTYIDTLDFNLSLDTQEDENQIHVENLFDELEFKFVFENALPIQIKPQMYVVENGAVIDSLFDGTSYINGCFDGNISEDVVTVTVVDEKLQNIQLADQMIIKINVSSLGNDVVINADGFFNLRIGLKTRTTEINMEDLNL